MNNNNTPTAYRQQLRKRILDVAAQEFRTKGIKSVKMDDIANLLSISKRTLYEIYDNKEQLLMESVREEFQDFDRSMQEVCDNPDLNVIDVVIEFYKLKIRSMSMVVPTYYYDLQKYPDILDWLNSQRSQRQSESTKFYEQGISEGLFRSDVNYDLISDVSNGVMDYVMEQQLYTRYPLTEIFRNVVLLYIRGFCTVKGVEELQKHGL
ncbi:MAG: TetR/AcrR family transcriptional regulator [Prevotella sp.]|nr:TetR/AcrR family transcriptional regulator [Prevotella sp.]